MSKYSEDISTMGLVCSKCKHEWAEIIAMEVEMAELAKRMKEWKCPKCRAGYKSIKIKRADMSTQKPECAGS